MLEELGRHPVRRVVPYKQYVVDKFGGKKGEVHEDVGQGE
jgi:alkyl sulfatase BDS1-like metallo-beta-lactamase superfamily hydrolase